MIYTRMNAPLHPVNFSRLPNQPFVWLPRFIRLFFPSAYVNCKQIIKEISLALSFLLSLCNQPLLFHRVSFLPWSSLSLLVYNPSAYLLLFSPFLPSLPPFPSLALSARASFLHGIKPSNGKERQRAVTRGREERVDGINRGFNREPSSLADEIHINAWALWRNDQIMLLAPKR